MCKKKNFFIAHDEKRTFQSSEIKNELHAKFRGKNNNFNLLFF